MTDAWRHYCGAGPDDEKMRNGREVNPKKN